MEKKVYQQQMEAQIREWDAEINALRVKIQASAKEVAHLESQLEALQEQRHAVKSRLDDLKEAADDAWDDVREGLDRAWVDLRRAGTVLASYFKQ